MKRLVLSSAIASIVAATSAHAADIAFDMVGSASSNLIEYRNDFTGAFGSPGDGFQKYQRGVSASIPFSVLDDSLSIFTEDSLGIVKEGNVDEFFGVTDTVNNDNSADVQAQWRFCVRGATDLNLSIDMGAMGDFEAADFFRWSVSLDGGPDVTVFESTVDESGDQEYTLEGGSSFLLEDPMLVDGIFLSDDLATFSRAVDGSGDVLTLTLVANTDGGSEAFAFQNILITGDGEALGGCGDEPPVGPELVRIHDVQGSGDVTPLDKQTVTIEGIVVGDFQDVGDDDNGDLDGFFVQEEDADQDGDPMTSEGLFVFDGSNNDVDVKIGDVVRVTGQAGEFFDMTQLSASEIVVLGSDAELPAVTEVLLPLNDVADYETVEGMRVTFPQPLLISEYFNFDRFGEIVLALPGAGEPRPMTPTAVEVPGSNGYLDRLALNERSRITLDDGRTNQNPDPAIHPNGGEFLLDNRFRGGDTVQDATGVINFAFGRYRLQPTQGADYTASNPRPEAVPDVGGALTVAAFNVLNYFTTLDERGADNAEEFTRQRDKIIAAIAEMDADVVGLIEIENNEAAIVDLVDGLNTALGEPVYSYIDTGVIGGDQIKVAFIHKDSVTPLGEYAVLDSSVDPDFIDDKNRPALAQTFQAENGGVVTVVVNHFKSKGSDCVDLGDPDLGDGQGNCNGTRTDASIALANWLATDPTDSGDPDFLIIGDLNAYDKEDPIQALIAAGYTDLVLEAEGEFAYSYVFDGQFGYLDYALANESLAAQVTGTAVWHINADEPDILDYDTSFKQDAQDALYEPNAFRSSDHDPVIVGLNLATANVPGDIDGDGDVDRDDRIAFWIAFGSVEGGRRYNPAADFDDDGFIGFRDWFEFRKALSSL